MAKMGFGQTGKQRAWRKNLGLALLLGFTLSVPLSAGTVFSGTLDPTAPLSNVYLVWRSGPVLLDSHGALASIGFVSLGGFAAGVSAPFTAQAVDGYGVGLDVASGYVAMVASYGPGVGLGVNSDASADWVGNGRAWSYASGEYLESDVLSMITGGDLPGLGSFVQGSGGGHISGGKWFNFSGLTTGIQGGFVLFSTASDGGSFAINVGSGSVAASPEPMLWLPTGILLAGCVYRVRRSG